MPAIHLPADPNLEQLKAQAKDLLRRVRLGETDLLPEGLPATLSTAQLVVARGYGLPSWPALRRHVELVRRLSRDPGAVPASARVADEYLRLTCLTYSPEDSSARRRQAAELRRDHPQILAQSIHVAAATADAAATAAFLADDRDRANLEGGPFDWPPLLYLAFARVEPAPDEAAVLATANALLTAGADPNAGYLWQGLPMPFTVRTGALGEGEQGPDNQPRHPSSLALARLLLEAGADANDAQGLYNRMFGADNDHLRLLFEFGLGQGDGGPWAARLGAAVDPPTELVADQLRWAVIHGLSARVELMAEHGVDLDARDSQGRSPAELAVLNGHPNITAYLVAKGATLPSLNPPQQFIAAALVADHEMVARLTAADPDLPAAVRRTRPGLIVWAAAQGRPGSINILLDHGFDVNARARTDLPIEQEWETALHHAAATDDLELIAFLLAHGADPSIHDQRFDATALDWARHFGHEAAAALS